MQTRKNSRTTMALWLALAAMAVCLGCSVDNVLDDTILQYIGLADAAPLPAANALQIAMVKALRDESLDALIIVEFERTDGTRFKWDGGGGRFGIGEIFDGALMTGGDAEYIPFIERCEVNEDGEDDAIERITIGSLDDPTAPGAAVIFPNNAVSVLVPFGTILQRGLHYNCGDLIRFTITDDPVDHTEWTIKVDVQCAVSPCGATP